MVLRPLGEIADLVRGISFPKEDKSYVHRSGDVACLRTTNVQKNVEWDDLWFVPAKHVKRDDQNVRAGDILISTANSYELVGKVAQVTSIPTPATLGAFISLIRPKEAIHPKFLYHQLAWGKTQTRIRELSSNTTNIANVSTKKLATLDVIVPSLERQEQIVSEIETQFSRLDEAVANLQRVKANLKRYKASILKAAVEGHLVETEGGWQEVKLGEIALSVRNGYSQKPDAESGTRIFRISAVRPMELAGDDVRFLSGEPADYANFLAGAGDVLFTRYNGSRDYVGVCASVPAGLPPTVYPDKLIRVRVPNEKLLPAFLVIAASTGEARAFIESMIRTTAGQSGVSGTDIKAIPLSFPSVAEQVRIVAEVDLHLSIIRGIETVVDANLRRAQSLLQATLNKAFSPVVLS